MGRDSSKAGGVTDNNVTRTTMLNSVSGKPFDANDYTTWTPGTTFDFSREGDIGSAEGKTRRTSARTLKGVVEEVRGNTLVTNIDSNG